MNLHARGQALQNRVNGSLAGNGVSVTYTRGATAVTLVAAVGRDQADDATTPTQNARLVNRERDYFIALGDLVAAGFGTPDEGDTITETINGAAVDWVATRQDREACWRWADHEQTRVRVHTRKG